MKPKISVFALVISLIGTIILIMVDWRIWLGVTFMMWANNYTQMLKKK